MKTHNPHHPANPIIQAWAQVCIYRVSAWKNDMVAMAKTHPWQKGALGKSHGAHGKKGHDNPERNAFRVVVVLHNAESSCFIIISHRDAP